MPENLRVSLLIYSRANLYPPGVWFANVISSFSGVTFILFCFVFVFMLSLKPRPFVQSFFVLRCVCVPTVTRVSFLFLLFFWNSRFFRVFLDTITVFSLYLESTSHVFPRPGGVFLLILIIIPCDHGLGFLHQVMSEFNQ